MAIAELASDLARALDPVRLAEQAGISPDPWQCDVLRSVAARVLLLCSRQAGKSTITSILAVHTAVYEPGSLVLLLSPTLRQSGELFKKASAVYSAIGRPVPSDSESAMQLELENGSRGMVAVAVGVDLGQKRDPTAIAVVEAQRRDRDGRSEDYYITRFLERLPLGTPYPDTLRRRRRFHAHVRAINRQVQGIGDLISRMTRVASRQDASDRVDASSAT